VRCCLSATKNFLVASLVAPHSSTLSFYLAKYLRAIFASKCAASPVARLRSLRHHQFFPCREKLVEVGGHVLYLLPGSVDYLFILSKLSGAQRIIGGLIDRWFSFLICATSSYFLVSISTVYLPEREVTDLYLFEIKSACGFFMIRYCLISSRNRIALSCLTLQTYDVLW